MTWEISYIIIYIFITQEITIIRYNSKLSNFGGYLPNLALYLGNSALLDLFLYEQFFIKLSPGHTPTISPQ